MLEWIFLDVGNVLLDEDPLTYLSFLRHAEAISRAHPGLAFRDVLAAWEARAAAGSRWPVPEVVSAFLDEGACDEIWASTEREVRGRFAALSPMIPGAAAVVERLARRHRLGLIANQGLECRARLAELGLLRHFDVVALSEEVGRYKPDPALFEAALDGAGSPPGCCLMVGDRLDNDLAPARGLGMATAWVRWPRFAAKGWRPDDPNALAYRDALERVAALAPALRPHIHPTLVVDETRDLDAALRDVEQGGDGGTAGPGEVTR
ncbi:MAG: HAD family hydrolase [Planctomycetaceae bacterium]|nr:HAD family hydrolase [Planctomycetaceae bacterium]MBV8609107.1 HAD family hydrolase [Singulisphaera sp.]